MVVGFKYGARESMQIELSRNLFIFPAKSANYFLIYFLRSPFPSFIDSSTSWQNSLFKSSIDEMF